MPASSRSLCLYLYQRNVIAYSSEACHRSKRVMRRMIISKLTTFPAPRGSEHPGRCIKRLEVINKAGLETHSKRPKADEFFVRHCQRFSLCTALHEYTGDTDYRSYLGPCKYKTIKKIRVRLFSFFITN